MRVSSPKSKPCLTREVVHYSLPLVGLKPQRLVYEVPNEK
jgi:hypothetical protein